ncbi:hypothetical protein CGLO_13220 [Colletotrichum gloeosporioides Cg-14]|uniref:Uncharacterized protein n=1 Tax=Colletotrichum gloeosporioides (strain Cg-14) TaxID=1237896 RepID=T0LHG3_COLGC|nr:hypothetical protein CGLO_13220 [Colletotrichum gloeosporioides Cg-14]
MGWRMLPLREEAPAFADLLRKGILLTLETTGLRLIFFVCNGTGMVEVAMGDGFPFLVTQRGSGFADLSA